MSTYSPSFTLPYPLCHYNTAFRARTDYHGAAPYHSLDSITNKLFTLPDQIAVYPSYAFIGWTVSSIGEEKRFNPRLAGKTEADYVAIMRNLNLPSPKMMDIALPANMACGQQPA